MTIGTWATAVSAGAVLVTVNQRLSRHYLHSYQQWQLQQARLWWETPVIVPWRSWLRALHGDALSLGVSTQTLLPAIVEQKLWRQCVADDAAVSALLDKDATASSAQSAWQTAQAWRCGNTNEVPLSVDQQAFSRWCQSYTQICKQRAWLDDACIADHLIELIGAQPDCLPLPKRMLLAGFLRLTPQQQHWCDALRTLGVQVELIGPDYNARTRVQAHLDEVTELQQIAAQTRSQLAENPALSLGVIVPDLQQRRTAVLRAFDREFFAGLNPQQINALGRPYDISLGLPLIEQSVVRVALVTIRLILSEIDANALSSWLLSPYLLAAKEEAAERQKADRVMRQQRVRTINSTELVDQLAASPQLQKALRKILHQRFDTAVGTAQWAERFGNILLATGWPGKAIDSEEYQAIEAWHGCLDDMQLLDDGEQLDSAAALRLIGRLSRERIFQPEVAATPIQIMGRLESHGVSFDSLWIAAMDAEQWPPSTSPNPFLSIKNQQTAGVPEASAENRLALAEDEFKLWTRSASTLFVSHALVHDGAPLKAASVLTQFEPDVEVLLPLSDPARSIWSAAKVDSTIDTHGPSLAPGTAVRGGARLLENQARCPFKAFALHRLQIKPLEEAGMGLDARQHGTLLHAALEAFWRELQSHEALCALNFEALDAAIFKALDGALDSLSLAGALRELERRRVHRLLHEWLTCCELPRPPFEVIEFEASREVERQGVRMTLQVDRIDRLDSGETLILDYKTGTANSIGSWSEDRIESPQLPLYALSDDSIDGVCFAQVARHKHRLLGVASDAELLPGVISSTDVFDQWSQWQAHWGRALDAVAVEVSEGLASVTPTAKACDYCELKPVCRIDQRADGEN